ncbi:MAG: hypothetical protein K0Q79_483 [Flavipsychrobacter sp.]|nr:hypothetical protein [Flavipsychrobacter sp.]
MANQNQQEKQNRPGSGDQQQQQRGNQPIQQPNSPTPRPSERDDQETPQKNPKHSLTQAPPTGYNEEWNDDEAGIKR